MFPPADQAEYAHHEVNMVSEGEYVAWMNLNEAPCDGDTRYAKAQLHTLFALSKLHRG
jgi:hypothetical protein